MCSQNRLPIGSAGVSQALPRDVEQPAVKHAPQPAILEPAVGEIGAAVRAVAVEEAETALLVAEQYEILSEQAHGNQRSLAGNLLAQSRRMPIVTHQPSARRARSDTSDAIIFLLAQHRCRNLLPVPAPL